MSSREFEWRAEHAIMMKSSAADIFDIIYFQLLLLARATIQPAGRPKLDTSLL